jgi:hypothetical protein
MIAIDTVPPEGLLQSFPNLKAVQFLRHGANDVLDRINGQETSRSPGLPTPASSTA